MKCHWKLECVWSHSATSIIVNITAAVVISASDKLSHEGTKRCADTELSFGRSGNTLSPGLPLVLPFNLNRGWGTQLTWGSRGINKHAVFPLLRAVINHVYAALSAKVMHTDARPVFRQNIFFFQ